MIKSLKKLRIERICLNIVKAVYNNLIADTLLNGEKLKIWNEARLPLFPLLLSIVLDFLARAIRQEKEMKGI
jgi:hypothetical protein